MLSPLNRWGKKQRPTQKLAVALDHTQIIYLSSAFALKKNPGSLVFTVFCNANLRALSVHSIKEIKIRISILTSVMQTLHVHLSII